MATKSLKDQYDSFVQKNEGLVRKLQEIANILVFLVPGNNVDGELVQEGGLAAINLLVMYHAILFDRKRTAEQVSQKGRTSGLFAAREAVRASRHANIVKNVKNVVGNTAAKSHHQAKTDDSYKSSTVTRYAPSRPDLRLALTLCAHTEVVAEMLAIRTVGDEHKWPYITLIEFFKCACRLWLLLSPNRSQSSHQPSGTDIIKKVPNVQHHGAQYPAAEASADLSAVSFGGSGGRSVNKLELGPDDPSVIMKQTMEHRHNQRQAWAERQSEAIPNSLGEERHHGMLILGKRIDPLTVVKAGEILHIIRPVVHSAMRWQSGQNRWRAFLASVLLDLSSSCCVDIAAAVEVCRERGFGNCGNPTMIGAFSSAVLGRKLWTAVALLRGSKVPPQSYYERLDAAFFKLFSQDDRREFSRRRSLWLYYFLRDPLFERLTYPMLSLFASIVGKVPLMGGLAEFSMFSILYYQKKYFWFAGSSSR